MADDSMPPPPKAADPRVELARKLAALAEWAGKVRVEAADLLDVVRAYAAYREQDGASRDLAETAAEVAMDLAKLDGSTQRLTSGAARAVHGISADLESEVAGPMAGERPKT